MATELCRFKMLVRVKNITNERTHWAAKARYSKSMREHGRWFTAINMAGLPRKTNDRFIVTMIRESKTAHRMDGDGLQAALKPCRDGIADALGINDGSERIEWRYDQKKTGEYAVEVVIERK